MSQNEQGTLYAFRLSGSRMRKTAANLRRHGQALDALTLVRRAAEQDDTSAAWFALAEELRLTCNWEAATQPLARVMSRDPEYPGVWMEMARCLEALNITETALDCAFHQLRVAPWSPEGDAARSLIARLQAPERTHEIRREQQLIHRAMSAWQDGDRQLGEKRIRRALRIMQEKERLLVTTAMLCMMHMDLDGALRYLTWALRVNPQDTRTLTAMSTLFLQREKPRLARGFLRMAGQYAAENVLAEDSFLTTAWAQDAWAEMNDYLQARRKRMPYRTALQSAEADMLMGIGMPESAREMWRDVVAANPDDRYASAMLTAELSEAEQVLSMPGMLPGSVRRKQMEELQNAADRGERLLSIGSRNRRLLDWCITSSDAKERRLAMTLLEKCDQEEATGFLRELLCRPFCRMETRQWALLRLADLGCSECVPIMMGGQYSIIGCRKTGEAKPVRHWRNFLSTLLNVTRRHRQSNEIVDFAADLWRMLPEELRSQAGDKACYTWCVAVEALYLRSAGEEEKAVRAVKDSHLSPRRVSRVIRRISRCVLQDNIQTELENGDT